MTLEIVLRAIFGDDMETMARETGENPFAVLTQESARDLQIRLPVSQAGGADRDLRGAGAAPRAAGRQATARTMYRCC